MLLLCLLIGDFHIYSGGQPPRNLRCQDRNLLTPSPVHTVLRNRAFHHSSLATWDILHSSVASLPTISCFKTALKTHYFRLPVVPNVVCQHIWIWLLGNVVLYKHAHWLTDWLNTNCKAKTTIQKTCHSHKFTCYATVHNTHCILVWLTSSKITQFIYMKTFNIIYSGRLGHFWSQ